MDANDLRVIITVILFVSFLGIVLWAYSSRQKTRFDEAANLPFADDEMQERTILQGEDEVLRNTANSTSTARSEDVSHG